MPATLSNSAKLAAEELKNRILCGEEVPLADLLAFLKKADFEVEKTRPIEPKRPAVSEKDIDFF